MGFAFTTLSAFSSLQTPLQCVHRLFVDFKKRLSSACPNWELDAPVKDRTRRDSAAANTCVSGIYVQSANHRPVQTPVSRPLRGNWPFNVRPPSRQPDLPPQPSPAARWSFLPPLAVSSRRHAFLSSLDAEPPCNGTARTVKCVSDARSGRWVIAGRMGDVCAELDRLAELEGLQA